MNVNDEHLEGREENRGDHDPRSWGDGQWDHGQERPYGDNREDHFEALSTDPAYHSRASDYFQLLAIANETSTGISRPSTTHGAYRVGTTGTFIHTNDERSILDDRTQSTTPTIDDINDTFPADKMAEGYFKRFFQEEYKLGMGANGSVFLCQVYIIYMCAFFNVSNYIQL